MKIYHVYMRGDTTENKEELFKKHRFLSLVNVRTNKENNACYYYYQKNRTIDNLIILANLKKQYCELVDELAKYDYISLQITRLINQKAKGRIIDEQQLKALEDEDNEIEQIIRLPIYRKLKEIENVISINYD